MTRKRRSSGATSNCGVADDERESADHDTSIEAPFGGEEDARHTVATQFAFERVRRSQ
ncbi:MAG: hypothetical protein ACRENK_15065 [Gemmatimonadaceae bacterium]